MIDDIRCLFSLFSLDISFVRFFLQICGFREASHAAFCSLFSFAEFHLMLQSFLLHKLKGSLHADSPDSFSAESAVFRQLLQRVPMGNCSLQLFLPADQAFTPPGFWSGRERLNQYKYMCDYR